MVLFFCYISFLTGFLFRINYHLPQRNSACPHLPCILVIFIIYLFYPTTVFPPFSLLVFPLPSIPPLILLSSERSRLFMRVNKARHMKLRQDQAPSLPQGWKRHSSMGIGSEMPVYAPGTGPDLLLHKQTKLYNCLPTCRGPMSLPCRIPSYLFRVSYLCRYHCHDLDSPLLVQSQLPLFNQTLRALPSA